MLCFLLVNVPTIIICQIFLKQPIPSATIEKMPLPQTPGRPGCYVGSTAVG